MDNNQLVIPHRYNVYMQDLEKDYVELKLLGFVNTISEARNMCSIFREVFSKNNEKATVFFQLEEIEK